VAYGGKSGNLSPQADNMVSQKPIDNQAMILNNSNVGGNNHHKLTISLQDLIKYNL
jgi:hypothetical protein